MPLLNICAVTSNKKTVQIGLYFLSGEKNPDYSQAIRWFKELKDQEEIESPVCFVTDREIALMKAIDQVFLDSVHFLCTWHVNMNILANCRTHFLKDKVKPKANEARNRNSEVIPNPQ